MRHLFMARRKARPCARAFTLLELVLVLSIVGVLSAIAVPRFQRSIVKARADAAANRIAGDLRLARARAMQKSTTQSVVFTRAAGNDGYGLPGVADLTNPSAVYRVSLSGEPYLATLVSVTAGGDQTLIFDGFGVPDSAAKIVVQAGEFQRAITVDGTTGEAVIAP